MKKKIIVPLLVFLMGICLVTLVVYKTDTHEKEQSRTTAQLNATTYGERIKNEIINGIEITDVLKQLLISENGEINQFDTIAKNIMSDSVESVQLAPAGIVTDIYPAEGNEAGKIDLIHDKERGEISIYARDHHTIVTQGPFELKQGGYGIAVRNPIYLKDENGQEYFWGFTIVILRVPDIFSDSTSALSKFGYEYSLLKTDNPWSDNYKVVYQSDDPLTHPISYDGKNGCMAYREGLELRARKQLGFAFRDISEHLPGAFIIYRADKEDDELFYANQEFLHMAGYKDMDELFRLTKKSFRNLIREDEQKKIEASIWKQIDNGNGNDYIHFHLRRADGSYLSVLDHGRIVENQQYGKIFYVLFMDWEDMKSHYSEKFSG